MMTKGLTSTSESIEEFVEVYSRAYKPYIHGAFGRPKRDDLIAAASSNNVRCYKNAEGRIAGLLLRRELARASVHADFSGRECRMPEGSVYVPHIGVLPGFEAAAVTELLQELMKDSAGRQVWLELHEENTSLRGQVEHAGFGHVLTKVTASSDIRGLYSWPFRSDLVPPLPLHDQACLICVKPRFLSLAETAELRTELDSYLSAGNEWAQHYSSYNKRHSWTAFALRGYAPDNSGFIAKPAEMSRAWKSENSSWLEASCSNTNAARYLPRAMGVAARLPGKKERIRYMRLASLRGELSRHADVTDRNAGLKNGNVARLHIPVLTHQNVKFEAWDLRGCHHEMHFAPGGLYYMDQRKPHRVSNPSPVERIHLVIDVIVSEELRALPGFAEV